MYPSVYKKGNKNANAHTDGGGAVLHPGRQAEMSSQLATEKPTTCNWPAQTPTLESGKQLKYRNVLFATKQQFSPQK